MFKMLKPRWLTVLTGVAVCTLMCAYTASDSWAAMCMVGYDTSACEGSGGTPKPACDPTKEKCGPTVNPPATCPNKGQTVTTDCQRLGYSERGAKPYPEDTWPKKALDKNGQPSSKWKCEPCTNGSGIVYDNSCYARYNCYASCQDENAATNVNGTQGPINGWGKNTTITSAISRKSRAYRDQFVRSQAECDILFGTKAGASGRMVSNYKFYWITKNICGSCEKRPCDGAEIVDGCYEICENKYTLEDGTQCCNKLDTLVSMNPAFGDADYWYPSTSPKYHHSGCYNTERQITAYGDFNNLGEENEGKYCYHQTPMTCADSCEEPKEDNGCACGPKSCETLATETGKPYSASHSSITENSVIYSFSNGEVERVNGICYQKTPASNCPSTGCYTLSRLTCPNGEPDSDCSCGTGCPSGSIPESDYLAHSYYINGKVLKDGSGNDKDYCLELSGDGATCATWSKCYTYNECSDLGDFLTSDGAGGCMCNWPWKTEATDCDIGNAIDERLFSPPEGNIYKHDMTSTIDAIRCKKYDGVTCNGVLASGPDSNCQCQCTGDYTDYYLNSTYQGYSD
ncbi:MAG: hypothetical protein IKR92_05475, partial [Alphaproteobacteria bacterium]|nr:hypothetical protein [Alphaproteobacteria bacterium]